MQESNYPYPFKITESEDGYYRLYRKRFGIWWRMYVRREYDYTTYWKNHKRAWAEWRIEDLVKEWEHKRRDRSIKKVYYVDIKAREELE